MSPRPLEVQEELFAELPLSLWGNGDRHRIERLRCFASMEAVDESSRRRRRAPLPLAGVALMRIGDLRQALPLLERAVRDRPDDPSRWNDLATAQLSDGQPLSAWASLERAEHLDPDEIWTAENRARAEIAMDRNEAAVARLENRLVAETRPSTRIVLAAGLLASGKPAEAQEQYRRALARTARDGEAYIGLGRCAEHRRSFQEAEDAYSLALSDARVTAKAGFFLGRLNQALGKRYRSLEFYLRALDHCPAHRLTFQALAALLAEWPDPPISTALWRALDAACRSRDIDPHQILRPALRLMRRDGQMLRLLRHAEEPELAGAFDGDPARNLLLDLLRDTVVSDIEWEGELTEARRRMLAAIDFTETLIDRPLAAAMADQACRSGFVAFVTAEETARLAQLDTRLSLDLESGSAITPEVESAMLVLAMYQRMDAGRTGVEIVRRGNQGWPPLIAEVLRTQVWNPAEELRLGESLPGWDPVPSDTGQEGAPVRRQYEQHPYPVWSGVPRTYPQPAATVLKKLFPHFSPAAFLREPCRILVAGCGTGQHPLATSRRFLSSQIVAVDVSRRSLGYGVRMSHDLALEGVSFLHGDLMHPPAGEQPFDLIECAGVLHHLRDPEAGWRNLESLLRPGGVMKVGLYSSRAREGIREARRIVEENGFTADEEGVRKARTVLAGLGSGQIARGVAQLSDYYSMSGCIDLLFHVQEQTFDLDRVRRCLRGLGLRFIGFETYHEPVGSAYRALFPSDVEQTNLTFWQAFEELYPLTFLRMYQFWCEKPLVP